MPKINAIPQDFIRPLKPTSEQSKSERPQFSETLKGMLKQVNETQLASGEATRDFIAGEDIELHEVMTKGQEAQLSFQFMLEVRNKLLEAYQEIQRMPV